jgi:heat shock protein HtpX
MPGGARPPVLGASLPETRGLWGEIHANRRRSWLLLAGLSALLVVVGAALGALLFEDAWGALPGAVLALVIACVWFPVAWFAGPRMTLTASRARRARSTHEGGRERDRMLINVVEEMAIASGLPVPEVWVIEDSAPNAFATGRDPRHAMVAVTTGLYDKLTRDELQSVIAHELAHIRNEDVRYATLVVVTVGVIALLADFAIRHMRWGGGPRRSRNREAGGLLILLAIVIAILAPLSARLLQAAISRRRETLADLSAVEMTRYPEALASALEKIAADPEPLEAANRATAPLYVVNPLTKLEGGLGTLFSTHPPTEERVRLLRSIVLASPNR